VSVWPLLYFGENTPVSSLTVQVPAEHAGNLVALVVF
jgi:hypothetical protein